MSYSVNYNQNPISYGTQVDPAQAAGYGIAAYNNTQDDSKVTDGLGLMSVFSLGGSAIKTRKYAKNTGKTYTEIFKETTNAVKKDINTVAKSSNRVETIKEISANNKTLQEIINTQASLPNAKKMEKMDEAVKSLYTKASETLKKASKAKTQKSREKLLNEAKTLIEKASTKTTAAEKVVNTVKSAAKTTKTVEKASKTVKTAKTASKAVKTAETAAKATKAAKVGSKLLKGIKGNALFLAIEGGLELATNVVPTFKQLGAKKGMKQLGKSAVKVGASVGGWAAGAAIGAAIGSVIPGAGTAIGAAVGSLVSLASSLICSSVATKVADKIVGKNELEIAKEQGLLKEEEPVEEVQVAKSNISNADLFAEVNGQTTTQEVQTAYNPYQLNQTSYSSNPFMAQYTTQDTDDNLLMMPLKGNFQFVA